MTTHIICYEGTRLSLGLMAKEYGADFVRYVNLRGYIDGTRVRPPYAPAHFDSWFETLEKDKGKNEVFAILIHDDSGPERAYRYVGHTGIHSIQWPEGVGITGSIIGDPAAQGKGYGTEAKLLLQKHAFDTLHLFKLKSEVKAFNAPSLGHLIACGYRISGRWHKEELHEGQRLDALMLECFREDWEPIWQAYKATGILPKLTDE